MKPGYDLLNTKTQMVMSLGRGEIWRWILRLETDQRQTGATRVLRLYERPDIKHLHTQLVEILHTKEVSDLGNLAVWIDGILHRLEVFIGDTKPLDLLLIPNISSVYWQSQGWPLVFHAEQEFWPEVHCKFCLTAVNYPGMPVHTKMCTNPEVRSNQKYDWSGETDE